MKTNSPICILKKLMFVLALVYLSSCQKDNPKNAALNDIKTDEVIITKINIWLESQRSKIIPEKNVVIESVKNNLSFNDLRFEKLSETEKLIIVPIKTGFKSAVNKDKNPINLLLLIVNEMGNIRKGNIVQFIPKTGTSLSILPNNTFYKFYNTKDLDCDGMFTFLNMNDKLLYQMGYTNGKLSSYGEKVARQDNALTTSCIQWFWITTYYYSDGSTSTTSEYLFTSCSEMNETINNPDDNGGGAVEVNVHSTPKLWYVAENINGYWAVFSIEEFDGVKKSGFSGGGYFTGITHKADNNVNYVPLCYQWQRENVSVSYSGSTAKSSVSGIMKCSDMSSGDIFLSRTYNFNFSQIFP